MKSRDGLINAGCTPAPLETLQAIDWQKVDWRFSNNVIARELGISDQTVATHRKKLGAPKSSIYGYNNQRKS